jgi:tripartite ATP-independent transporter DctM subunit
MSAMLVAYIVLRAALHPGEAPADDPPASASGWARFRPLLVDVLPLVGIFAFVVGAMSAGWATPTEAAALGALATIVAALAYRSLTVAALRTALLGTAGISGMILFIIMAATTFSQILSFSGATNGLVSAITGMGLGPHALLVAMLAILLLLGCFIDQVSMMLITLPFYIPLVQQLALDPVWFGVLFLICMQLGLLTPPFGLLLFTVKGVAPPGITMRHVTVAVMPFVVLCGLLLVLVYLFPPLATWLPRVLAG